MSCCGACGGQDLEQEKQKQEDLKKQQEQQATAEQQEPVVKNWEEAK